MFKIIPARKPIPWDKEFEMGSVDAGREWWYSMEEYTTLASGSGSFCSASTVASASVSFEESVVSGPDVGLPHWMNHFIKHCPTNMENSYGNGYKYGPMFDRVCPTEVFPWTHSSWKTELLRAVPEQSVVLISLLLPRVAFLCSDSLRRMSNHSAKLVASSIKMP